MKTKRFLCLFAMAATLAMPVAAGAAEKPALVIRIQAIEGLIADVKYLAELGGKADEAGQVEGLVKSQTSEKGLIGIDTKKPLGAYAVISPDLTSSTAAILIPIADEATLLDFLKNFDVDAKKGADGIYSIKLEKLPIPVPIFALFKNGYLYIAARDKTALEAKNLLSPEEVLKGSPSEVISGSFRLDQVPDVLKQLVIGQVEMRMAEAQEKKEPNESETERAVRVQMLKEVSKHVTALITEGGNFGMRLNVDRKRNSLSLETELAGQANSALAKQIAGMGASKSDFAGLASAGSAANGLIHALVPEEVRKQMFSVFEEHFKKGIAKETDAGKKQLAEKLFKAVSPSLKAGELDAGFALSGPNSQNQYSVVAGIKVKDTKGLEALAREVLKSLPASEQGQITLDAETVGASKIHRLEPKQTDAESKRLFGDAPIYVGVRSDALIVGAGADGLAGVKKALESQPKAARQLQFEVSCSKIMYLDKNNSSAAVAAAKKAFQGDKKDMDKIRVSIEGGESLKMKVEMQGPVVTYFTLLNQK